MRENKIVLASLIEYTFLFRLDKKTRHKAVFMMVYCLLDKPLAALISKSARHSPMVLMFLKGGGGDPHFISLQHK
jgi:hypothetical protein